MAIATIATAQIKITNAGNVITGGNSLIHDRVQIQIQNNGGTIAIGPNDSGSNIGSNLSQIDFWYPIGPKWNKIRSNGHSLQSDSTEKTDIAPIEEATVLLKQIKTYSYFFKSDSIYIRSDSVDERKREYGVLAQEVEEILPELIDTAKGTMFVNYNAFIAILIKGFNEQQAVIENLQKTVTDLQKLVYGCCGTPKGGEQLPDTLEYPEEPSLIPHLPQPSQSSQEKAILYQNAPNPFTSDTDISCYLPETVTQATLFIYNLQGIELKSYPFTQAGLNSITVYGSELSAGMYLYTLVVDNEIIDTKRMILTK